MLLTMNILTLSSLYYFATPLQNRYISLYYFAKFAGIFSTFGCIILQSMGKKIIVGDGHNDTIKTDHRNGKKSIAQEHVEMRPVIDGYHNETIRDRYKFGRDFVTLFSDDLNDLLTSGDLKFDDWRVLLYLIANLQKNNIAITNLDIISDNIGIDRTRVSRSLTRLKKRQIVVEMKLSHTRGSGPVTSVLQITLVNPNLCFNGTTKKYKEEILKYPKLTHEDGKTLLNQHAENQRQKLLREQARNESLFPELYDDNEDVDRATGEILTDCSHE